MFYASLRSPARKDHRGVDLISDALPFSRLWYGEPNAITNANCRGGLSLSFVVVDWSSDSTGDRFDLIRFGYLRS